MELSPKATFWWYIGLVAASAALDEARIGLIIGCSVSAIILFVGVLIPIPRTLSLPQTSEGDLNAGSSSLDVRGTKEVFLGFCWLISVVSVLVLLTPLNFDQMFEWGFAPYILVVMIEASIARIALARVLERRFLRHAQVAFGVRVQEGAFEFRDPAGERRVALGDSNARVEPVLYRGDDPSKSIPISALRFHKLSNAEMERVEEISSHIAAAHSEKPGISSGANVLNLVQALLSTVAIASLVIGFIGTLYQLSVLVVALTALATFLLGVLHSPSFQRRRVLRRVMTNGTPENIKVILSGAEIPASASVINVSIKLSNPPLLAGLLVFPLLLMMANFAIAPSMFRPIRDDQGSVLIIPLFVIAMVNFWFSYRWFQEQFLLACGEIVLAERKFLAQRFWGGAFEYFFRDGYGQPRGGQNLAHSGSAEDNVAVVFYSPFAPDSSICGDGMLFHRVSCTAESSPMQASAATDSKYPSVGPNP